MQEFWFVRLLSFHVNSLHFWLFLCAVKQREKTSNVEKIELCSKCRATQKKKFTHVDEDAHSPWKRFRDADAHSAQIFNSVDRRLRFGREIHANFGSDFRWNGKSSETFLLSFVGFLFEFSVWESVEDFFVLRVAVRLNFRWSWDWLDMYPAGSCWVNPRWVGEENFYRCRLSAFYRHRWTLLKWAVGGSRKTQNVQRVNIKKVKKSSNIAAHEKCWYWSRVYASNNFSQNHSDPARHQIKGKTVGESFRRKRSGAFPPKSLTGQAHLKSSPEKRERRIPFWGNLDEKSLESRKFSHSSWKNGQKQFSLWEHDRN